MVKRPIRIIATLLVIAVVCQDTASAASWTAAREPVSIPVRERRMPEIGFRIPDPAAFVEGGYRAPAADAKTLILIQDAHSNPSAQLNAARVIASAAEGGGFRTIYTEAAAGDVTLSKFLSPGADHAAARIAAEQAARKGRLAGFELADLSAPGRLTLWGVEDEKLYEEALELYRAAAAERRQAIVFLDRARRTGETLAEELLPVGALEVWRARRAHEAGDISTLEYFGKLRGRAGSLGIRTGAYPALILLERLARDEERMDPERIGSEQAAALAALTDRDRTELGEPARNNAGAAAQAAYWSAVLERVPAADQGSALVRYVAHLKRCRRLDAAGVLEQLERLENEVLTASAAAAGPSGAMDLIRALKALGTLHDVVLLRSTPAAFERYSRGRDLHDPVRLAAFLNARIRELDRHYDRTLFLNDAFDRAETAARRFYEVSTRRDAAMVGNLLARMEASGEERAILVAGGYHAPGLTRELERLGVSYVSVIPAAAHPTDTAFYEKILLSQKTRSADRALGGPAEAAAGSTPRPATRSGSLMLRPVVAGVRSDDPAAVETLRTIGIDPRSVLTASRPVPVSAGARMTHVAIASRGKHDDEHNQDSFLQMDLGEGWTVLGVFDGVGGSQSGAEASRRARDGIQRYLSDPEVSERIRSTRPGGEFRKVAGDRIDRVLQEALDSAQNEVRQIHTSQETYSATTALLALIKKDWGADGQSAAWVLNYGDGQAALWDPARPDRLRLVGVMNATGGIGRREMRLMKWRQNFLADVEDEKLLSAIEDFEADVLSGADHVHAEHEDRELLLARYRKLKAEGIPVPFTWRQAEAWIYRRMTAAIGNRETGGIYPVRSQEVRIPSGGVLMLYTDGIGDPLTRPRMLRNIRMNFGTPPAPTFRGDWRPAAMRLADELIWMAHDPNQTVTVQEYVDGLGAAGPVEYRANPRFKRDDATAAVFYNDPKAASGARMAAWKAPDLDPSEAEKVRQAFVRTPDKRGGRQEIFFLKDGVSVAVLPRMDQRPEDLKTFFDVVRYVRHISAFLNQVRVLERINPSGLRPDLPAVLGYDHASFARAETLARGLMDRLFTGETRNAEELRRSPSLLMLQKMMDDHRIFFVESRIDGESLSDYLKDLSDPARTEALPTQDRLLDLVRKMADIYAHLKSPETGLHHLDIKPSNFMVRSAEDGTLEVAQVDFSDSVLDRDLDDPGSLGHGIVELTRRYGIATASLRYLISGEQSLDPGSTVDEVRRHYTRRDLGAFLFTLFEIFQLEERRVRASKAASDAGSSSSEARGLGSIPVDDGWYEDSFARFSRLDLERIVRSSRLDPSIRMMLQTSIERVFLPPAPPDAADPDSSAYFQHHRDLGFGFFVQLKELVDALIERSPDGSPLFTRAVPVVPHPSPSAGGLDPDAVTRDADGVQKLTERASDISQTVDASAPPVRSVGPSDAAADVPDSAPLLRWRPAASEDPLKGFMEQIAREASGSSWTTRSHGEIGIRMVPEVSSGFRNVPAAKGRMRLLVYPSDPGLEFFQGSVSGPSGGSIHFLERPKNMLRHEEKLLSPLTAPKGTLGQIILNYAPAVEVQREGGAEVRLEHVIVVDAIQTRIGYEDIDAPFRRDLDLWRDAAIRRLEAWCAKYGMALLIAHPSTIFRNKRSMLPEPQAIRNYHRVFLDEDRHARKRLGWNPYPRTLSENEWYELSGREVFARMLSEDGSPLTERQAYIPSPRTRSVLEVSGARLTLELEREALRSAARSYTGSIVDFTPKKSEAIEGGEERIGRQAVLLGADKSLGSQFVFLPPTLPLAGGGRAFVVPERHALVIPDEEWTAKDVILTTHVYACSVTSGTMRGADGRTMRFFAHTDAFGGHVLRWLRSLVGSGKARSFDLLVLAGRRDVEEGSELLRSLSMFKDEPGIRDRQPGQELNFELRSKPTALSFTLVKSGAEGGAGVLTQWAFGGGDAESEESIRRVQSPDYSLKIDWSGATPSTVAAFGSARGPEASAGARMAAVNAEDLSPNRRFKLLPEDSLDIRFPGDGTLRLELRREDWFGRPGSPQLAFALLKKGRDHSFSIGGTARQRIESRSSPVAGDPRQILSIGDGTLRFSYRVLPDGTVRFENLMRGGPLYLSAWLDPSASGARMSVSSDPPDDATRRLSRLWMKGKESMPELIFEARRAGFDGVRVRKSRIAAIPGNPRKLLRSPVSGHADTTDLWDIENIHEDQTLLANIIQHAGGEGVFLWRDTPAGYEYLVFDWGPGVRDDQDGVMEDLSGILDLAVSFRKGKLGPNPDQTNTGGMGFALHYAAKASSLMRVASANGGSLRVADKTDPDPSQASDSRIPVKQWGIALPDDVRSHTGFMVHGLSAYFPEDFRGHITAPDASDPIGRVVVTKHRPLNRPDASRRLRTREVPGLSDLEPGDHVRVHRRVRRPIRRSIDQEAGILDLYLRENRWGGHIVLDTGDILKNEDLVEVWYEGKNILSGRSSSSEHAVSPIHKISNVIGPALRSAKEKREGVPVRVKFIRRDWNEETVEGVVDAPPSVRNLGVLRMDSGLSVPINEVVGVERVGARMADGSVDSSSRNEEGHWLTPDQEREWEAAWDRWESERFAQRTVRALELYDEGWDSLSPGVRRGIIKAIRENSIIKSPSKSKRRPSSDRPRRSRRSSEEDRTLVLLDEKNKWLGHATFEESSGRSVYLSDLVVKKDQRGRDLGTRLMDELFARLRSSGHVDRISWMAAGDSAAFYQKYLTDRVPYWQGGDEFMALVSASSKTPEDFRRNHPSIHDRQRRFLESLDARSERVKEIIRGLKPSDRIAGIDESGRVRYPMKAGNQGVRESRAVRSLLVAKVGRIPSWSLVRLNGLFDEAEEDGADRVVGTLLGPMDDGLNLSGEQTGWKRIADPLGLERHVPEEWRRSDEGRDPGARMAAEQGPGHGSFLGADAARELIDHFGESTDKVLEFMFGDGVRYEEIQELTVAPHSRQSNVRGIRHVLSFSVRRDGDPAPKTFFIKFYTSIRNEDEAKREMFDEAEYHRRITRQFGPDSPVIRTMIVQEPTGIWASRNGVRHIEVQEAAPGEELRHDTVIDRALWRQAAVMLGRLHQHVFHRDLFVRSGGRRGGPNVTLKRAHVFVDATPGRERVTFIDLGMAGPADGSNRDRADAEREIFLENFEHMFGAGMVERGEYPDLASARADFMSEYQRGLEDRAKVPSELSAAHMADDEAAAGGRYDNTLMDQSATRAERLKRSILADSPIQNDLRTMGADVDRLTALPFYEVGQASFGFGRRSMWGGDRRPGESHITAQGDLLREDIVRLIRQREASGDRRLVLAQAGLGDIQNETSDLIDLVREAFEAARADISGWDVDLILLDIDPRVVRKASEKFGPSVGTVRMHYHGIDLLDSEAMGALSERLKTVVEPGVDYFLTRNVFYENMTADAMRDFALPTAGKFEDRFRVWTASEHDPERYGFTQLISLTLTLKNVMRYFGRTLDGTSPGTRYLIDPVPAYERRARAVFAPAGMTPVGDPLLGMLELTDGSQVEGLGLYSAQSGFRVIDTARSASESVGARMATAWSPVRETDREDHRTGSVRIGRFRYVAADASGAEPAQDIIRLERPLGGRKDLFDYDRHTELALQMIDEALEGAARPVTAFDFGAGPGALTLRLAKDPAVQRVIAVERSGDEIAKLERALKVNGVLYEHASDPDAAAAAARDPKAGAARVVIVNAKFEDYLRSLARFDSSAGPGPSVSAGGTDLFVGNLPDVPGRSMARALGEYFSLLKNASDRAARIIVGGGWDVSSSFGRKRYSLTLPDGDPDPHQPDRAAYARSVAGLEAEGFRFGGRVLTESGREFFGLVGRRDPGARMAAESANTLPVAEKHLLNSRGETMKEVVARLRSEAQGRLDHISEIEWDPIQWTFHPDHGGQAERERLSRLTRRQLGEEIKARIRSGVMANWSGLDPTLSGEDFLKAFIDLQSSSSGSMSHHLANSRQFDRWAEQGEFDMSSISKEERVKYEYYKAILQEIAARWTIPSRDEGSIENDFGVHHGPDLDLYMRARHGGRPFALSADEARKNVAEVVVASAYALNYAARIMGSAGGVAAVVDEPFVEPGKETSRELITSSDWFMQHAMNNLAQGLGTFLSQPDGFSRSGFSVDYVESLESHLLNRNLKTKDPGQRYGTYRDYFVRAAKDLRRSIELFQALLDAEPKASALERYPMDPDWQLPIVPRQALGYYLLSKAFVGREERLADFRGALKLFLDLAPIVIEELDKIAELPGLEAALPQPPAAEEQLSEPAGARMAEQPKFGVEDLAQDLTHHYQMSPQVAIERAEDVRGGRWRQDEAGGWTLVDASGRRAVVLSERGTRRFLDANEKWILTLDPNGNKIDELQWDARGRFVRAWTLNTNFGEVILEPDSDGSVTSVIMRVRDWEGEKEGFVYHMDPGIDMNRPHLVPYGMVATDHEVAANLRVGFGVSIMRMLAILASDEKSDRRMAYTGNLASDPLFNTFAQVAQPELSRPDAGFADRSIVDDVMRVPTYMLDSPARRAFRSAPWSVQWRPDPPERVFDRESGISLSFRNGALERVYHDEITFKLADHQKGNMALFGVGEIQPLPDGTYRLIYDPQDVEKRIDATGRFLDPIPNGQIKSSGSGARMADNAGSRAEFERWVDLGRGPLGDEERDFLVRFTARVHRETSLRTRLAAGDGALRLPVGVTSQHGFAVIGARERKGEVELFVGRNVIYRGATAELDAIADREARNAAEALADAAARSAGEFERELIDGVARLEGSPDFNRFIQIEVSQLISRDPRTRAAELRLLVSALKWIHEQKAHVFTKFYLNPEGLDDREEGLVRTLAGAYRMRVGAPSPDEIRHHNAVPVVWRAGKSGSAEETGPDTFDGWVNVLFPEPGEGLQPYGRAAYLSKAAVLGAVPDAGSSKDLWGDFRRARPEAFDPNIFDQARVFYPENTFESPADFLPAIREPGPTRRPALLSHLIRVGARLAELQRAIQQTEIMA